MSGIWRYLLAVALGVLLGVGLAVHSVRAGAFGSNVAIGPWRTGLDFGTADASARTRAVVALRGLLALPAREARYYTAATDDAGQLLDGRCRYRIAGGALPGKWWSLTVYDADGYLVANPANIFSVESAAVAEPRWQIVLAPARQPGHWLPTGGREHVELTLRTYLPPDAGRTNPPQAGLPSIVREGC
ncbi:DUF1214 domain-containing protein [Sphingomonas sp.]|uniref:DUF1214 domain-containing protein n=1 Tax=Sphingomonas sp. TaxID=28214 RepID=UPI003CC6161C